MSIKDKIAAQLAEKMKFANNEGSATIGQEPFLAELAERGVSKDQLQAVVDTLEETANSTGEVLAEWARANMDHKNKGKAKVSVSLGNLGKLEQAYSTQVSHRNPATKEEYTVAGELSRPTWQLGGKTKFDGMRLAAKEAAAAL